MTDEINIVIKILVLFIVNKIEKVKFILNRLSINKYGMISNKLVFLKII